MADILTDEQVREIALAIGHKPFVGSLIATLQHVQAKHNSLIKIQRETQAEIMQLMEINARLRAENERLKDKRNGICADYIGEYKQENTRLREILNELDAIVDFTTPFNDGICDKCKNGYADASGINTVMEKARQALATEGEMEK